MKRGLIALGLILALLGGVGLATGGFTYQDEEAVVDLGSVEASASVEERVDIPPLAAGSALLAGIVLVSVGVRRSG